MRRYLIIGAGALGARVAAPLHAAGTAVVLIADGEPSGALPEGGRPRGHSDGEGVLEPTAGDLPAVEPTSLEPPVAAGPDEVRLQHEDVLVFATTPHDTEAAVRDWRRRPVEHAGAPAAETLPAVLVRNGLDAEHLARHRFAAVIGAVVAVRAGDRMRGPGSASSSAGTFWLGAVPTGEQTSPRDERAVHQLAADLVRAGFAAQVVDDLEGWAADAARELTRLGAVGFAELPFGARSGQPVGSSR